jgi:Cu(I)/Ag(I) efflux system membrane protein CusA/SilA
MIERIIAWSANNRFLVFLAVFFSIAWGVYALVNMPLDAIPDLSDVQVIIFTEWMGRSPDLVEDQVTYPIVTSLISAPEVRVVRGYSFFGLSFVYAIFEDGTDMYWARSRVLEYMNEVAGSLPEGVTPTLGPDATGVGWAFEYALIDRTGTYDLAELRSIQDWYLKYWLESVPGVAEVASVGGFVNQYQVTVDPNSLLAYNLPVSHVIHAIRTSNNDVGGRIVELAGTEYMVRGRGYIKDLNDIRDVALGVGAGGTPILLSDVAQVSRGPDIRRGLTELDGEGEVVGGIVVMRYGENALAVIERVKEKIEEVRPALPEGVEIVTTYDRTDLIHSAIENLQEKLLEEILIVSLVCLIFLFHIRSALVVILALPVAILMSFTTMYYLGVNANIMSLGGIAIAIGVMVDAAIVMVENAHKRLEQWGELPEDERPSRNSVVIKAAKEVGKPLFFSLLVITVSFLPVFTLEAQEGRLFKPLAFTKTFAMFFASLLSITLVPLLMVLLIRGRIAPEHKNPMSRILIWFYRPFALAVLRWRKITILLALIALAATGPIFTQLGSEFMPPLWEGTMLYMPSLLPGVSIGEVARVMQVQNRLIGTVPEVEMVFGKAGRSESATDPAPLGMIETVINLKPQEEWRPGLTPQKLEAELDELLQFPGVVNTWTMPIKGRIDMLSTGIRTPIGVKVFGPDLNVIQSIGERIELVLGDVPGTRNVLAERVVGGYFLDFEVRRKEAARYGLNVEDVEALVETAVGGKNITQTIEGRERYPVNVRYARELRDDLDSLKRVLVAAPTGAQVPIGQLADIRLTTGPPVIKSEDAQLVGYVFVDVAGRDLGSYVQEAQKVVAENVEIPSGYYIEWSGQYEYMQRAKERLIYVVPLTLLIIFLLLYLNFESVAETLIVMLSVPFAMIGAVWLLWYLEYNLSVAVWVGMIALAGVASETGVVMIVYLDEFYEDYRRQGLLNSMEALRQAVLDGAVQRVRPKMMTVAATMTGLLPIMWGTGSGADMMKRIAAPMVGGMVSSTVLTLLVIPSLYVMWRGWQHRKEFRAYAAEQSQGGDS